MLTQLADTVLNCAGLTIDLAKPQLMGVLNVTPDSFSDGGKLYRDGRLDADALCRQADAMVQAGVAFLDVGGESTRPGADPVSASEELDRVVGAVECLRQRFDTLISLDTSTPVVMTEGVAAGANLINDVRALTRAGALTAAAAAGVPVCLMHMQGEPGTMQQAPRYDNVTDDVIDFLQQRVAACREAGINTGRIIVDPGFGFGKTAAHNYQLLRELDRIVALGYPVLAGLSRKSMIAAVIDRQADERLPASLALAVLAASKGARILRVHDVAETADALAMVAAMESFYA